MMARLGKLPAVLVPITTPVPSTTQASLMLMPVTMGMAGAAMPMWG